jgi:hypothetical protein
MAQSLDERQTLRLLLSDPFRYQHEKLEQSRDCCPVAFAEDDDGVDDDCSEIRDAGAVSFVHRGAALCVDAASTVLHQSLNGPCVCRQRVHVISHRWQTAGQMMPCASEYLATMTMTATMKSLRATDELCAAAL